MSVVSDKVLHELRRLGNPRVAKGVERFGIKGVKLLGIPAPKIRRLAKSLGINHSLSLELWESGWLEARALAAIIGDPSRVTKRQMETWVHQFDNWGVCDACCSELFVWTPYAREKAFRWIHAKEEFVRRAGFVMMAEMALHLKDLGDEHFFPMLDAIRDGSTDERNFVKKAVNWALRQIGKRNSNLLGAAMRTANEILSFNSSSARWVASDALREFRNPALLARMRKREKKNRVR